MYLADGSLLWHPSSLYVDFSEDFLIQLANLYRGFFENSEELYEGALRELGLLPDTMESSDKEELLELLISHFGSGKYQLVEMKISNFTKSFDNLFCFLQKKGIKVSADFLFLGVYLLTLYMHLDTIGGKFDVKGSFDAANSMHNTLKKVT